MKTVNPEITRIVEGIIKTNMSSSSLKAKTAEYFHDNPEDIGVLNSNMDYIKSCLKKGDEVIHAIYEYYYRNYKEDKENHYLKQYSDISLEKIVDGNFKTAKKAFRSDEDNSGIFNYKVFVVSNEVFGHDTITIEEGFSKVSLVGDNL